MTVDTPTGPVEVPARAMRAVWQGDGVVFECDVCKTEGWSYSKSKTDSVRRMVALEGWRWGLRDVYETHGWTCGVCSAQLTQTDVRAEEEEMADG